MKKKMRILPLAALAVVAAAMWLGGPMVSAANQNQQGNGQQRSQPNGAVGSLGANSLDTNEDAVGDQQDVDNDQGADDNASGADGDN